jgi:glycosyltransferase involved in cell wall biosynthesis
MPNVSVIIPTYNRAFIVKQSVDSVLQQTFGDYEIIVVDDGSTDNTGDVLKPYGDKIHYDYKKNGGISSARNRGLEIAAGDYIAFLDSDDFWKPEKLEKQMAFFREHPEYGMVATRCLTNTVDRNFTTVSINKRRRYGKSGWVYKNLFYRNFIRTSSVVVKKECFEQLGVFDESLPRCEEIDMWLRIAKKYQIGFINDILTVYTRRPIEIRMDSVKGRKNWIRVLEKNYDPELIPRSVYNRRMARIYAHMAENLLKKGKRQEGENLLLQTLALYPLNFRAWKNRFFLLMKG